MASPGDRNFLVVVESGSAQLNSEATKSLAETLANSQVVLLWLTDANPNEFVREFFDRGIKTELITAGDLLQKELYHFTSELENWAEKMLTAFGDLPDFWSSHLSEFNFMHPLWFDLVRFNVFADQLLAGKYLACYVSGSRKFVDLCGQFCQQRQVNFQGKVRPTNWDGWRIALPIARWALNLVGELWTWLITRRQSESLRGNSLIYAQYPRNWRKTDQGISNRFAGLLSQVASDDLQPAYLVSITRQDLPGLKPIHKIMADLSGLLNAQLDIPYSIMERFGSLRSLLRRYFWIDDGLRWLKRWQRVIKLRKILWRGVDVKGYLWESVLSTVLVDWPKNRYLEDCLAAALKHSQVRSLLVPIYELCEGHSLVRAGNRLGVKTIGLQHHALTQVHRWRVISSAGIAHQHSQDHQEFFPNQIAIEGLLNADWFAKTEISENRIEIVGAPRITQVMPAPDTSYTSTNIMILGEYYRPQILLDWCAANLGDLGYSLVFRPHPTHYVRALTWLHRQPRQIQELFFFSKQGISLEDDIQQVQPLCVLANLTGATVDLAQQGWPVGIILSNWLPDYSPMTAFGDGIIFASNKPAHFAKWIKRIQSDEDYRHQYSTSCRRIARLHYEFTQEEAARKIAALL